MPSTILELIDLKSFSSIWYWLVVGTLWARAINAPMTVPLDILRAAAGGDANASHDVVRICAMQKRRRAALTKLLGPMQTALWAFFLTVLLISGWGYGAEFAQAVFLIAAPMSLVSNMTARYARRLPMEESQSEERHKSLFRLKNRIQITGLASVFVSAIWGMLHNLTHATF